MNNLDATVNAIEATLTARKEQLPIIRAERNRVSRQLSNLVNLREQLDRLLSANVDDDAAAEIVDAKSVLSNCVGELEGYRDSLDELEAEFTRNTLNIGVSGAARTGKSTTLQHITGLTDRQIPSGGLNPVTAVRSEIYNSPREEAVVTFKTELDFIERYVRPHVANVNECLEEGSRLSIESLAALKTAELPERLEGAVSTAATDSLKRLREAVRSATSYEGYLGASPTTVALDDVIRYVTYPPAEVEAAEASGGHAADRRYLAVELVQEYCQFPNLGNAKVGLVDLPGLGEIGNSAAQVHLKGLEDKVDQILLVMMPNDKKAFADHEVACNLDELQAIQPAVNRGDLIVAGINRDETTSQAAVDNLHSHFEAEINAGRVDRYELVVYCAVNDDSVAGLFAHLLDRLGKLLPDMDRQKVERCMGAASLGGRISAVATQVVSSMDRVLRNIPSSDRVMKERIDAIERSIIGELRAYSAELEQGARDDSEVFDAFTADAQGIHDDVQARITDGLFRANAAEWLELTSSSKDYYNLYRDECKRIRYEIIDAYCGLDRFYGVHVSNFKIRVLDTLLRSCGMDGFFKFTAADEADDRIAKVASELGSTLHDDDLDSALRLLAGMRFDFRSNVFLQIEEHLAELANPSEKYKVGSGYDRVEENKRKELGGQGECESRQKKLAEYLEHDANAANDAILEALKGERDRFNKYLAVSIDFFNNYLFGKDEDGFKQVVVRGLIREYKQWVLPDADDASRSPLGRKAREVKESALALANGNWVSPAASSSKGNVNKFAIGAILVGKVTSVEKGCVRVDVDGVSGVVPKGQISHAWVEDAREFARAGDRIKVKVLGPADEPETLKLSMKQCS